MKNNFDFENKSDEVTRIRLGFKDNLSDADIRQYKDPEGLDVAKMDLGLWYVESRERIVLFFYFLVFAFGMFSWVYFFYQFGTYIVKGMRAEKLFAQEVVERSLPTHEYYTSLQAKNFQLFPVQIIRGTGGKRDLVSQIINPNKDYWARFNYHFLDGANKVGSEKGFVFPAETKQLVLLGTKISDTSAGVKLVVDNVQWGRINRHEMGNWERFRDSHLNFKFSNVEFVSSENTVLTEKTPLSELKFHAENRSSYSYWNVPLLISLYNYNDLITMVPYEMNDFESLDKRNIALTVPGSFKKVTDVKIVPNMDITRKNIYKEIRATPTIVR